MFTTTYYWPSSYNHIYDFEQPANCRREADRGLSQTSISHRRRNPTSTLTPGCLARPMRQYPTLGALLLHTHASFPGKCSCNHIRKARAITMLSTIYAPMLIRVWPPRGCQEAQREAGTKVAIYPLAVVKPARP
jgi:hypothetical protein